MTSDMKKLALNMLCTNYITPRGMEIDLARAYLKSQAQLAVAVEALDWYRDATRYECGSECCRDNGDKAVEALAKIAALDKEQKK